MRLLLVEDEKRMAQALRAILQQEKYDVDHFADGWEGLLALETKTYDLAVLDVMLPGKNGFQIAQEARKKGVRTPILMLTAKSELDDKVMGLDCGADDYLTKPFATKELLARVRAMMRRKTAELDTKLTFEDLELSPTTFQLGCKGEWVYLANKEYQIMEMLLANPRCVLSAGQFIEAVWGCDSDVENNVVWTYISRLRRILKQLGSKAVIRTAKGIGFALEREND